jgi:GT2 family glycosyltransferase
MMVTVVVPTRDRREVLGDTLQALLGQVAPPDGFEVIVVDNGSLDGTEDEVRRVADQSPVPLTLLVERRPGPAAARNRGVEAARGDLVLFLGDDMMPAEAGLVSGHVRAHARLGHPRAAVLGCAIWNPRRPVTAFMRWLEDGGPQFRYADLAPGPVTDVAAHFYTANLSVPRPVLEEAGGFDERFPFAAVEDNELGARLQRLGVSLHYVPQLLVLHDHPTELAGSLRRLVRVGRSAALYNAIHPDWPQRGLPAPHGALWLAIRAARPLAAATAAAPVHPRRLREAAWRELHLAAYAEGYALGPPP